MLHLCELVILVLSCCIFAQAKECSCNKIHIQKRFCGADFVIQASVKSVKRKKGTLSYHVEVEGIFKQNTNLVKLMKISTLKCHHSCCLPRMIPGTSYIISGHIHGELPTLSDCDSIFIKSSEVTAEQLSGLNGGYSSNCVCVNRCKFSLKHSRCFNAHSYCSYSGDPVKRVDLTQFSVDAMGIPGLATPYALNATLKGFIQLRKACIWGEMHSISVHEHFGTHMDAPSHTRRAPGGWTVDQIPVDNFFGHAVVIDIREKAKNNTDAELMVEDIIQWENKHGRIKDGSIIFMYSGWDRFWGNLTEFIFGGINGTQWHFPGFNPGAAKWLVKNRNIKGIGVDSPSLDNGITETFLSHIIFLESNVYGIEMVNNLGIIPPSGAKVVILPMKNKGGSGGPTRLVAEYTEKGECEWKSSASLQRCKAES